MKQTWVGTSLIFFIKTKVNADLAWDYILLTLALESENLIKILFYICYSFFLKNARIILSLSCPAFINNFFLLGEFH